MNVQMQTVSAAADNSSLLHPFAVATAVKWRNLLLQPALRCNYRRADGNYCIAIHITLQYLSVLVELLSTSPTSYPCSIA
jgi:hypothetical protein